ncbi:hypothetical protein ACHAXH_010069 [Discostella pseudostelligera]
MFRNTFQSGFLSILYSIGSKPLQIWDSKVKNGHINRITDQDIQSSVLEILGTNVSTNYIVCPADSKQTIGIKLPFLVMIIKNLNKYFTFEVQVLDDKGVKRRFRASNYQSTTRVKPFICTMPMRLDEGWNQIQFNLSDFTRRAYGTNYVETVRVQIHANCRIRRIYFSDRLYSEEELPPEFKLFIPTAPATRGITSGVAGGDKISLRGKEATIDKLSEVNEDEIIEETSAELRDGPDLESSESSPDLNEMDHGNDLNEDGLIEQLHAESPRQGIALSS